MFDSLMHQAASLLGAASPTDISSAMREHVSETDGSELAQHLTEGAQTMDSSSLAALGQSLLGALRQHGMDSDVANAGVSPEQAASGDQESVVALIQHAAQNPETLRTAAVQLVERNPQILTQLPGLVHGVLGKLH
jgi:hypothetical protein